MSDLDALEAKAKAWGDEHVVALIARVRRAEARVERLEKALRAVDEWRGLDGDGITDPVRGQVKDTLASDGTEVDNLPSEMRPKGGSDA